MGEKIFIIYSALMDCTILISLIFSIVYWKSLKKFRYLSLFPIYTGLSLIVDLENYLPYYDNLKALPENIFTIVEFLFFYNFYKNVLLEKKQKIILRYLFVGFILFSVIIGFFFHLKYPTESFLSIYKTHVIAEAIVIGNILLVIPTLLYYKSLFNPPFIRNLTNDPVFLIMTGVLFCFSISTPIFIFSRLLFHYNKDVYYYLFMINCTAYLTMHIFFIKAYINTKIYA